VSHAVLGSNTQAALQPATLSIRPRTSVDLGRYTVKQTHQHARHCYRECKKQNVAIEADIAQPRHAGWSISREQIFRFQWILTTSGERENQSLCQRIIEDFCSLCASLHFVSETRDPIFDQAPVQCGKFFPRGNNNFVICTLPVSL